ncbi:hypothetical protein Cgig2_005793 [Carnegiea gigantea]|uniref:Uncharacterized protein n=1 Tax=Carnegiea gigantea TaxID=171969 RepID=A0A9Q1KIY4_9CARY|nr:hypothetical protein Cgig2_005793 [Carnegiea gigantea]
MDAIATATATATSAVCPPFFIHCPINGGLSPRTLRARYIWLSTSPCFPIYLSSFTLRRSNSYPRDRFFNGFDSRCNLPNSPEPSTSDQVAVFLEVDGVLIDAYLSGKRQAFNVAFQKLGLDCAKWTEPVYSDLFRCKITFYFLGRRVGTEVPTGGRAAKRTGPDYTTQMNWS